MVVMHPSSGNLFSTITALHTPPHRSVRLWNIAVISIAVALPCIAWAIALTFTERAVDSNLSTASHAIGIDFDGDGDKDIVTSAYGGGDIDWYRNNGSQSFSKISIETSLGAPIKIQVTDLDDDGDLDVVAVDFGGSKIVWYENNGSMVFAARQNIDASLDDPIDLYVGDFTGDGIKDVIGTASADSTFALYKNDGDENFTQIAIDAIASYNIAAGDLDGDGDLDVLGHATGANDVFWYRNSGTGSFTKVTIDTNVSNPRGMYVADIDDDADNDFVISAAGAGDVLWFRNSGTGSFTRFTVDSSIGSPFGLDVMDLDDDGDEDILAVAQTDSDLIWYDNDGSETFTERTIDANFAYAYWVSTEDIDRDGLTDVVSASYNDGDVSWWEHPGTPRLYISSRSPADNAIDVSRTTNLVLTFSGSTFAGTGTLTIKRSSNGSTVETITLSGSQLSGNGTSQLTINPSVTFEGSTGYYVNWSSNAFKNSVGSGVTILNASGRWNFTTVDVAGPTVSVLSPVDDATNVSPITNLVLTFNETTRAGTGTLTIKKSSDDSTVETITVSGALLSGNGSTQLTLNPSATLADSTSFYIVWGANTFKDRYGNHAIAVTSTTNWNFTTSDTTAPVVSTLSPADGAINISPTANLVLTFNETTRAGTGTLTIKKSSDDSTVETITVSGALLSGNGSTQLTLNPTTTLSGAVSYYVIWGSNAFKDTSSNHTAAVPSTTAWNFTTHETTAPTVSTLAPTDDATDVATTANLVMTFDEIVLPGTGSVIIKKSSDNSSVETIAASGALVTGSGSTQITINPSTTLTNSIAYYVTVDANAFQDASGNDFAGISAGTTWNFTTVSAPAIASSDASTSIVQSGGGTRGATMSRRVEDAKASIAARFQQSEATIINAPSTNEEHVRDSQRREYLVRDVDGAEVVYRDVLVTAWYAPYVASLVESGIAEGYRDPDGALKGEFGVHNSVTYAEVLKMAFEAAKEDVHTQPSPRNTSALTTWAAFYVSAAEARQLSIIVPTLDVHTPATRAEVVQLMLDLLNLPIAPQSAPFMDVPDRHPHSKAIATAFFHKIIQGDTGPDGSLLGTFRPDEYVNRAEVAKIVALLQETIDR